MADYLEMLNSMSVFDIAEAAREKKLDEETQIGFRYAAAEVLADVIESQNFDDKSIDVAEKLFLIVDDTDDIMDIARILGIGFGLRGFEPGGTIGDLFDDVNGLLKMVESFEGSAERRARIVDDATIGEFAEDAKKCLDYCKNMRERLLSAISTLTGRTVDMDHVLRVLKSDEPNDEADEDDRPIYLAAYVYDNYAVGFSSALDTLTNEISQAGKAPEEKNIKKSDELFDPSKLRINAFSDGDIVDIHNGVNVPKDLKHIIEEAEIYFATHLDPSAKVTHEDLDIAEKLLILKPGAYSRMMTVALVLAKLKPFPGGDFYGSIGKYITNRDKNALDRPAEYVSLLLSSADSAVEQLNARLTEHPQRLFQTKRLFEIVRDQYAKALDVVSGKKAPPKIYDELELAKYSIIELFEYKDSLACPIDIPSAVNEALEYLARKIKMVERDLDEYTNQNFKLIERIMVCDPIQVAICGRGNIIGQIEPCEGSKLYGAFGEYDAAFCAGEQLDKVEKVYQCASFIARKLNISDESLYDAFMEVYPESGIEEAEDKVKSIRRTINYFEQVRSVFARHRDVYNQAKKEVELSGFGFRKECMYSSKYHKAMMAYILREKLLNEKMDREKTVETVEKLSMTARLSKGEFYRFNDQFRDQRNSGTFAGELGQKMNTLKEAVHGAPPQAYSAGERIKFVFFSILCLALLAAVLLTPLKDLLTNEETFFILPIAVAVICVIGGVIMAGVIGLFLGFFVAMLAAAALAMLAQAFIPIMVIAAVVFLLRAFRPNTKQKKKRQKYFEKNDPESDVKEIRSYLNYIRDNLGRDAENSRYMGILEYYDCAIKQLDDLVDIIKS